MKTITLGQDVVLSHNLVIDETDWLRLPGGELEAPRPRARCAACLAAAAGDQHGATGSGFREEKPICFTCYRTELARERALVAAGQLDTGSLARFQSALPFELVDRPRLARLRAERLAARRASGGGAGCFADRRRSAQISARHALQAVARGLRIRYLESAPHQEHALTANRAVELRLPDAWLPFIASR
jgi:hypothetical protein